MTTKALSDHATIVVRNIEKYLLRKRNGDADATWDTTGITGAAANLLNECITIVAGEHSATLNELVHAIRERDTETLLKLARTLAFRCMCSYPYGPHTLECLNGNFRLRGATP